MLNVAKSLRESPEPEDFEMGGYINQCGTPACALGHYACRPDLQRTLGITKSRHEYDTIWLKSLKGRRTVDYASPTVLKHFGITQDEAEDLFSGNGCDYAETPVEAAKFIEKFVASK